MGLNIGSKDMISEFRGLEIIRDSLKNMKKAAAPIYCSGIMRIKEFPWIPLEVKLQLTAKASRHGNIHLTKSNNQPGSRMGRGLH